MNIVSALDKKLIRDLIHMRGQGLAVGAIVACGVAIMVMALGAMSSLELSRDTYYERYRFADVFSNAKRAPERLVSEIGDIDGVRTVQTRITHLVTLDIEGLREPANGLLVSLPESGSPTLNGVLLYTGRWPNPARPDEAVVSKDFVEANGYDIGSTVRAIINGRARDLEIVGIGDSPEHIYMLPPGALIPDEKRYGIFWMSRRSLEAAFDLDGAFNDVSLALSPEASSRRVIDELDDILEPYGTGGAYDREDQLSNAFIEGEMQQMRATAAIIPPVFLVVSAMLINAILARIIAVERQQVGLLKAFGFDQREIAWHYIKLAIGMVVGGILAGFILGGVLARLVVDLYSDTFRFPDIIYRLEPYSFALGALAAGLAAVIGAWGSARAAAKLPPAEAMSPAPPTVYGKGLVQRLVAAIKFDEPTRMILRHITRWPLRAAVTVLGVAASQALLVGTLFAFDSMDVMIEGRFHRTDAYDAAISFFEPANAGAIREIEDLPGVLSVQANRDASVRIRNGQHSERVWLVGLDPDGRQRRVTNADGQFFEVPESGVALSTHLAELLDAGLGDQVRVEVLEGRRPIRELPVTALVEESIGWPAFMRTDALNTLLGEGEVVRGAYVMLDPELEADFSDAVLDRPGIASVALQGASVESFEQTLEETINIMMAIYAIIGGSIAAAVTYNAARIGLTERGRELASLRVLGFTEAEVSYILIGELALLVILALPLGGIMGYGLASLIASAMGSDLYRIPLVVDPSTYGFSALIVITSAFASALFVRMRVKSLDLIAVLKTRE
ncbi:MAG: FtsX-like permease family protein [Pseudomonadota bacterium]